FLLDPAHGFEMTDYPQWPFEVSQINRSDRALRELFGVAYYPGLIVEGEPAIADRQPFVAGVFGDSFDVLTAADTPGTRSKIQSLLLAYRVVIAGGRIDWSEEWIKRVTDYVNSGGSIVLNAAQVKKLPEQLLGVRLLNATGEANDARSVLSDEASLNLSGQMFRYEKVELKGAQTVIAAPNGDPLATVNRIGKGTVVFAAVPDLLGEDERMTPFAANMLAGVIEPFIPVKVMGDVEYLINKTANSWIITMLNNNGVSKTQQGMANVDRSAYVTATIGLPGKQIESATEWTSDAPLKPANGLVTVQIPPGGVAIVEIKQ